MARTIEEKIEPGMVIGKLTVLKQAEPGKRGSVLWLCRCECGTELLLGEKTLKAHKVLSCGCMSNPEDLTGLKFGTYTVLESRVLSHRKSSVALLM